MRLNENEGRIVFGRLFSAKPTSIYTNIFRTRFRWSTLQLWTKLFIVHEISNSTLLRLDAGLYSTSLIEGGQSSINISQNSYISKHFPAFLPSGLQQLHWLSIQRTNCEGWSAFKSQCLELEVPDTSQDWIWKTDFLLSQWFHSKHGMLYCLCTVISVMYETLNWKPLYFTMELLFQCAEKIHLYYIYCRINFNGELPGSDKILGLQEGYLRSHLGLDTLMVL